MIVVHTVQSRSAYELRPWSPMECSQPTAWTTNRSLLVASRVNALPRRPTNFGSTIPRAAHQEGGLVGSHQCITSHSVIALTSPNLRPAPLSSSRMHSMHLLHSSTTQPTIAMTIYAHVPTVTTSSAFHT